MGELSERCKELLREIERRLRRMHMLLETGTDGLELEIRRTSRVILRNGITLAFMGDQECREVLRSVERGLGALRFDFRTGVEREALQATVMQLIELVEVGGGAMPT